MKRKYALAFETALLIAVLVASALLTLSGSIDISFIVIFPAIALGTLLTINVIGKKRWWTRKRKINYALLVAFIVWLAISTSIPLTVYGSAFFQVVFNTANANIPYTYQLPGEQKITYDANWILLTPGFPSVDNPIQFTLLITNVSVNETYFMANYGCLNFLNGTTPGNLGNNPYCLQPINIDGAPVLYKITLGSVGFTQPGPTWFFLYPEPPKSNPQAKFQEDVSVFKQFDGQTPFVTVGPQSDTLSLELNEFAAKLAVTLGSFSILLLQPLIEGLLLRNKENQQSTTIRYQEPSSTPNLAKDDPQKHNQNPGANQGKAKHRHRHRIIFFGRSFRTVFHLAGRSPSFLNAG